MTERTVDTGYSSNRFVRKLPQEGKWLYAWLIALNDHSNQAGLYEITLDQMAFETGIPEEKLPELLELLIPKVIWYKEHDLVWIKNFIRRQTKNPKFLTAVAKCLHLNSHTDIVQDLLDYNREWSLAKWGIEIPYESNDITKEVKAAPQKAQGQTTPLDPLFGEICTAYAENIDKLTPIISDQLKDLKERYPGEWIIEAITLSVKSGKRNLKEIERILEQWNVEGKQKPESTGQDFEVT